MWPLIGNYDRAGALGAQFTDAIFTRGVLAVATSKNHQGETVAVKTPIWNIVSSELQRPRDQAVERIYRRVARLPKDQRSQAVRELIRAVLDMSARPTHTESIVFLPRKEA